VVTASFHRRSFVIQDETSGIFISPREPETRPDFPAGSRVEVEGFTGIGGFSPIVHASVIRPLGPGTWPKAVPLDHAELMSGNLDCRWVSARGIVREVSPGAAGIARCRIAIGGDQVIAHMHKMAFQAVGGLVDAEVEVQGVCLYEFTDRGQHFRTVLAVPGQAMLRVLSPAPAETPLKSAAEALLGFSPATAFGRRVGLRAVVTHRASDQQLYVRQGARGVLVRTLQPLPAWPPGTEIEVRGFPARGSYSPLLEDAEVQRLGTAPPPAPLHCTPHEALQHDAALVRIRSALIGQAQGLHQREFLLEADGRIFSATLEGNPMAGGLSLQIGSTVDAAGICTVKLGEPVPGGMPRPVSFHLLMRTPGDLRLVSPPAWWTRRTFRVALGMSLAAAALLCGAGLAWSRRKLREQERQRTAAAAQFDAIFSERNRVARELHDTLVQGVTAVSVNLEMVHAKLGASPEIARAHLQVARELVGQSLAEARQAIWAMRSPLLESRDLPECLTHLASQLSGGRAVAFDIQVHGEVRRLAPSVENHLLRIGQESLMNAIKHAQARQVTLAIRYKPGVLEFECRDDGRGMAAASTDELGGLGMRGIRERVEELHGQLRIEGAPGCGTRVLLTLPLPPHAPA
jgi:signal transduction histidine kinase